MRLVCISDTHGMHQALGALPDGDMLIHAGDFSHSGSLADLGSFLHWFSAQPHGYKILIAGNHDAQMMKNGETLGLMIGGMQIDYLQNTGVVRGGLHIWGSPYTPKFGKWSFMQPDEGLAAYWSKIPNSCDVLVTHGPPHGVMDAVDRGVMMGADSGFEHTGSKTLALRLSDTSELRPRLHVFGHIHEGYGEFFDEATGILCINASICDASYRPVNKPIVLDV